MIDFEQEIEAQLREFQRLSGKGNVRGSNDVLYEIIKLMMQMIARNDNKKSPVAAEPYQPAPTMIMPAESDSSNEPVPDTEDDPPIAGDHIAISSSALQHPHRASEGGPGMILTTAAHIEQTPPTVPPAPSTSHVNAPHGLTKFGNPRRVRPPRQRKPASTTPSNDEG